VVEDLDLFVARVLCVVLEHFIVVLHELLDGDQTVFVAVDPLLNMVRLQFGQNLNHRLLQPCLRHQLLVVGSRESFFPDLNSLDGPHLVPHLVVLLGHELPAQGFACLAAGVVENKDFAFLSELDEVEDLDAGEAGVEIIMEVVDILLGQSV
jgi:hypothetical protein